VPFVLTAAAYIPLNHQSSSRVLDLPVDNAISVVPIFAVPYLAFVPIFWLTILVACVRNRHYLQLVLTATLVYAVSSLTYLLFQTHAPRPDSIPDDIGAGLVRYVYAHDRPYCDFPSEHASSAVMLGLYFVTAHSPLRVPAVALAIVVLASTLLIDQHTLVGMLGGALLAPLAWALVARLRRQFRPL
jgi:membrane-associated phospholipid phosphatase